jgi:hypothetical protein
VKFSNERGTKKKEVPDAKPKAKAQQAPPKKTKGELIDFFGGNDEDDDDEDQIDMFVNED